MGTKSATAAVDTNRVQNGPAEPLQHDMVVCIFSGMFYLHKSGILFRRPPI